MWGDDGSQIPRYNYGNALVKTGKLAEGERMVRGAYTGCRHARGPADARTLLMLESYASCLDRQDKHAGAEPLWAELLGHRRKQSRPAELARTLVLYGNCLMDQEKYAAAEPLLLEAHKTDPKSKDDVVRLYEAWGKPDKAREWRAKK